MRYACNLLQKLAESCISPVFEASGGCKKLQNIAIPDRETGLINALQADAAKKLSRGSSIIYQTKRADCLTSQKSRISRCGCHSERSMTQILVFSKKMFKKSKTPGWSLRPQSAEPKPLGPGCANDS
jgi:hypothetical protein